MIVFLFLDDILEWRDNYARWSVDTKQLWMVRVINHFLATFLASTLLMFSKLICYFGLVSTFSTSIFWILVLDSGARTVDYGVWTDSSWLRDEPWLRESWLRDYSEILLGSDLSDKFSCFFSLVCFLFVGGSSFVVLNFFVLSGLSNFSSWVVLSTLGGY